MSKIFTVFKFELKNAIRSTAFIFSTLILVFMIIVASIIFKFTSNNQISSIPQPGSDPNAALVENIGIFNNSSELNDENVRALYGGAGISNYDSEEALKAAVENEAIETGLVINSIEDLKVINKRSPMFDVSNFYAEPLRQYLVDERLSGLGVTAAQIEEVESSVVVNVETETLNPINPISYPLVMALSFVVYIMVIMNGSISATSVAREKSDRTMELLITSTEPINLINGKVIASFVQGLLTLLSYGIAAVVGYFINKEQIDMMMANLNWNIDPMILVIFIAFFIVGYIMYLYVYAALGATVSKIEEVNVAITPVMLIIIVVYITTTVAYTNPDGAMMKALSFIPFSSPLTMHARYALSTVPMSEVALSFGILVVTMIVLSFLSIKLYRNASLNYGNQNKILSRLNRIFGKKKKEA